MSLNKDTDQLLSKVKEPTMSQNEYIERQSSVSLISSDKSKHIRSMYTFMDNVETKYYETVLKKIEVSCTNSDTIVGSETLSEAEILSWLTRNCVSN